VGMQDGCSRLDGRCPRAAWAETTDSQSHWGIATTVRRAQADRDTIVRNFISGQYEDALRMVCFNVAEGRSRDMS
jgi:hypothetical protein